MGILDMSYSCKNSQSSPFLHRCLSQCLQTMVLSPRTCLKGQWAPRTQEPLVKNVHRGALFSAYKKKKMKVQKFIILMTHKLTVHSRKWYGPGSQLFIEGILDLKPVVFYTCHKLLQHAESNLMVL